MVRFPLASTDDALLAAHRKRVAKSAEPAITITSIEQLAQLRTVLGERNLRWRSAQDADELLDADLRAILDGSYEALGERVKLQLGRGLPRARLRRS